MKTTSLPETLGRALLLWALALAAPAKADAPSLVPPTETYAGKTHAQWLESWYIWMFSVPGTAEDWPFFDITGANSGANQSGPVFFLPKSWRGAQGNPPEQRSAIVPEGTALFLPFDGNPIFDTNPNRDPATMTAENRAALEGRVSVFRLMVDGQEIPVDSTLASPCFHATSVFTLPIPTNAAARSPELYGNGLPTEFYPFQSHEWFVLLQPLPVGQHVIHSSNNGSIGTPNERVTDMVWTIQVVAPTPKNPPLIAQQPVGLPRSLGDEAVFTVKATGTAPLAYQWQKDGAPLAGQMSSTLTLTNLTNSAAGSYSVVITNTDGSVASNAAVLTVDTLFTVITGSPVALNRSFGASWGDYNNDGFIDLVIAGNTNMLFYRNEGGRGFAAVENPGVLTGTSHVEANVNQGYWADYDNDGHLDLFVPHGWTAETDGHNLFHGLGGGDFALEPTLPTHQRSFSAQWGDFDRDGRLDLLMDTFVSNAGLAVIRDSKYDSLFHNNGNGNGWLLLKLVGTKSNRSAIGAKVRLMANLKGKPVLQYREIGTGNSFGQNDLRAHFGLADATQAESIEIEWPSGYRQTLRNVTGK